MWRTRPRPASLEHLRHRRPFGGDARRAAWPRSARDRGAPCASISKGSASSGGPKVRMPIFPLGASAPAQRLERLRALLERERPHPERADDGVPRSVAARPLGGGLLAARPAEARLLHLLVADARSSRRCASVARTCPCSPTARATARTSAPGPAHVDEHALSRRERELPHEIEMVRDETGHPLLEVAWRRRDPTGVPIAALSIQHGPAARRAMYAPTRSALAMADARPAERPPFTIATSRAARGWSRSPAGRCPSSTRASSTSTRRCAPRPGSSTSRTWASSS